MAEGNVLVCVLKCFLQTWATTSLSLAQPCVFASTGQSTTENQKNNKPLTSFAMKDEDMVKEQDLLETNKSCLIFYRSNSR
jgi:hypothetical protein